MIGTKKLSEIREELLKSLGDDPFARLDKIIAKAKQRGERTDLTEGLKRFLARAAKTNRRKPKSGVKKTG